MSLVKEPRPNIFCGSVPITNVRRKRRLRWEFCYMLCHDCKVNIIWVDNYSRRACVFCEGTEGLWIQRCKTNMVIWKFFPQHSNHHVQFLQKRK